MQASFNFFQQWYPLTPIQDLDPQRPTPVTVLGQRLVIWKPRATLDYRVFYDQCPHRLARLSEGRVDSDTGHLMCSYHGWQFDAQGTCQTIPQLDNPELRQTPQPHLCTVSLPTQQANELLWVWLDPESAELAVATPLPLSPQIDAEAGFVWSSFVRDLEYDWQTLVENLVDPSHVPFAHHGVQGNRNRAQPIPLKILVSERNRIEAIAERPQQSALPLQVSITFQPPCRLEYAFELNDGKRFGLVTYCVPTVPGKSRLVGQFPQNFARQLQRLTPRWWDHIHTRNAVLDGDMILLHQQEQALQQRQQVETWKTAYKMPTRADRLVIEFRRWLDQYAQGQLPWQSVGLSPMATSNQTEDRAVLLDRYHQHTQICSSCRTALKWIQRLQVGLVAFAGVTVAGVAVLPDAERLAIGLPLIILACLGTAVFAWLKFRLEPQFYFVDYVHAER